MCFSASSVNSTSAMESGVVAYCRSHRADLSQQSAFAAHVGSCQYNEAGSLVSQLNIVGHKGAPGGYPNPCCRVTECLSPEDLHAA